MTYHASICSWKGIEDLEGKVGTLETSNADLQKQPVLPQARVIDFEKKFKEDEGPDDKRKRLKGTGKAYDPLRSFYHDKSPSALVDTRSNRYSIYSISI